MSVRGIKVSLTYCVGGGAIKVSINITCFVSFFGYFRVVRLLGSSGSFDLGFLFSFLVAKLLHNNDLPFMFFTAFVSAIVSHGKVALGYQARIFDGGVEL